MRIRRNGCIYPHTDEAEGEREGLCSADSVWKTGKKINKQRSGRTKDTRAIDFLLF